MVYRVVFATRAIQDLGDIVRFQARLNAAYAERVGYALLDDALSLAELPRRGLAVPERPGYQVELDAKHTVVRAKLIADKVSAQ